MSEESFKKRASIGQLSGIVGILCNCALAAAKLAVGFFASSMSVIADGLNNLSDAASSVVTLAGFKLAEKPADSGHPYGHARFEYLAGLTVAVMILVIGVELLKGSVNKIFKPEAIEFSWLILIVLVVSILVKFGMMLFYRHMGKKIQSTALAAAAEDSRNDVLTTGAVLVAALLEHFTDWRVDGAMGMIVSFFIIYGGIGLAKKTVSPLLGEGGNHELRKKLMEYLKECPMVLGCHDLMIHDYGPGRRYASVHVEIDKNEDSILCHENIDRMERGCYQKFGIHLVIHYDPVVTGDQELDKTRNMVETLLRLRDPRLSLHDFRMHPEKDGIRLIFDMVVPDDLQGQETEIQRALETALCRLSGQHYETEIIFDLDA